MTPTTILRTPPASTSYRSDCLPLRPIRGDREKDGQRGNSPSPTSVPFCQFKLLSEHSSYSSPSHPSPSPLRKRVLFERGSSGQCDSDDDDEPSPSFNGLHSPFMSRCASPFLGAWAKHCPKPLPSNQLVEDDEGIFLTSKTTTTPHPAMLPNPGSTVNYQKLETGTSGAAKPNLTPPATEPHSMLFLSPLRQRKPRIPQTPAETDWHLGEQAKSLTRLSLGEENRISRYKVKHKIGDISNEEQNSSPSPIYRRRGCKRSFEGDELPLIKRDFNKPPADIHGISIFHSPTVPSSNAKLGSSATALFSPRIRSPPPPSITASLLNITQHSSAGITRSSSSSPKIVSEPIAKKYRPRDSGIGGLDDDEEAEDTSYPLASRGDAEPHSLNEDNSGFITPGFEPSSRSAWPGVTLLEYQPGGVDEFIMKTLAAGSVTMKDKKIMPGTPVKRNAYAHSRPWMSSSKAMPQPALSRAGVPRKSLPLSFPNLSQIQNSPDGSDISPSDRSFAHRKLYGDVGKGRPGMLLSRGGGYPVDAQAHSLMRRSSSGAFSSSSSSEGSLLGTPTKPITPGNQPSASQAKPPSTKRPIYNRPHNFEQGYRLTPRPSFGVLSRPLTEYERPGKFEADFITIDSLGTGEFGSVLKVRYKRGKEEHVFAVKKSKSFEGVKHRRRLREEVDVLQHLSLMGGSSGHPNVLKYIDSWEQDGMLYIQTELCDLGNFGNFLAEYGTHFEALNEACVWKVCAELSNGLKFIHDAGVIHLDLKPANIFITCEGRFRIGDFGMASLWPRRIEDDDFEREGDREYMAPEILQGHYGKAADIFSFGMIMLETAANIVVPDMGSDWHRLRQDDFSAVDFTASDEGSIPCLRSPELVDLIVQMMRSDPDARLTIEQVFMHEIVRRAREAMERKLANILANGLHVFAASPLGGEPETFVDEVLQIKRTAKSMDLSLK